MSCVSDRKTKSKVSRNWCVSCRDAVPALVRPLGKPVLLAKCQTCLSATRGLGILSLYSRLTPFLAQTASARRRHARRRRRHARRGNACRFSASGTRRGGLATIYGFGLGAALCRW